MAGCWGCWTEVGFLQTCPLLVLLPRLLSTLVLRTRAIRALRTVSMKRLPAPLLPSDLGVSGADCGESAPPRKSLDFSRSSSVRDWSRDVRVRSCEDRIYLVFLHCHFVFEGFVHTNINLLYYQKIRHMKTVKSMSTWPTIIKGAFQFFMSVAFHVVHSDRL